MSLDFNLYELQSSRVCGENITHNLGKMAKEAGIYDALWHPTENGYTKGKDIIPILQAGLAKLEANPGYFKKFDSPNGWGLYIHFVPFVKRVLEGCVGHPDADIVVSI